MPTPPHETAQAHNQERIADLHIHSHYSRATSRDLTFEHLARWAQLKGVQIVATGDIAHPGWLAEMHASLEAAEEGLFRLKPEIAKAVAEQVPAACQGDVRFMLGGEISNIYKRHDAVRKVHNLIFAPTLDVVARIQQALERIGNIRADGRPILGLDSRDLLEIVLDVDARCALIPAHIWTPWFSMLGSKSGFDTVEECFGDLTGEIFALETGLSSDPPMNWRISNLDGYTLISNSDAHSPQKLAREATILRCEPTYTAIMAALRSGDAEQFGGTLEFFPEEGKYHLDGHRKCGVCWEPPTTIAHNMRCPVCGKEVTVGVMHRVEVLADRPIGQQPTRTAPFFSIVPLPEVLGEVYGVGPSSRRVQQEYEKLLAKVGPELFILRHAPLEEIAAAGGSRIADAIGRIRRGEIMAEGGYDGEYGVIRVFAPQASVSPAPQLGLFVEERPVAPAPSLFALPAEAIEEEEPEIALLILPADPIAEIPTLIPTPIPVPPITPPTPHVEIVDEWLARLNADQRAAATCVDTPLLIVAGPGTGKTRTLTVRIANLLRTHGVAPEAVLAITFTNKAAEEMRARLTALVGEALAQRLTISTFHAFGAQLLREWGDHVGLTPDFVILDDDARTDILRRALPKLGEQELNRTLDWISQVKNRLLPQNAPELVPDQEDDAEMVARYQTYGAALVAAQAVDFDDLVRLPVQLLTTNSEVAAALHARYRWLSVDEYQDVNPAQYQLLRVLVAGEANVCVIGDPDQSIYSFRGANPAYFHAFVSDFPGAVAVELRQSYRSPHALLEAATQVIANNPDRPQNHPEKGKESRRLWSEFTHEVKLEIYPASTDRAEAEYLVHSIEQAVGGTSYFSLDSGRVAGTAAGDRTFGNFAILYRLGAQRRALIEAFDRSGIPYQIVGDALTSHRHIREVLALLRLRAQPTHALLPLTTLLGNGKGELTDDALTWLAAQVEAHGVEDALRVAATTGPLKPAQRRKVGGLLALWVDMPSASARLDEAIPLVHAAWASWQGEKPTVAQHERIAQLRLRAVPYGTHVADFLDHMALQRGADTFDPRADRVAILSLHAAKGLEFPVVYMVGCEEGLLPYLPPSDSEGKGRTVDIAEERRLFYVGMTRAQETLTLTYAARRLLFGQMTTLPPSRFIDEIEAARKALLTPSHLPQKSEKVEDLQLKLF